MDEVLQPTGTFSIEDPIQLTTPCRCKHKVDMQRKLWTVYEVGMLVIGVLVIGLLLKKLLA